jgi:hypothetical protein
MSGNFEIEVLDWLASEDHDPIERETLASVRIVAPNGTVLTEVQDTFAANTVRSSINVPAALLAEWFLVNWWRLRWEPLHEDASSAEWRFAHSTISIGEGYAWPDLSFSSDGELVHLRLDAERSAKRSSIRFLRSVEVDLAPAVFEHAIDSFVSTVEGRVTARLTGNRELSDLRSELWEERNNPEVAEACKLQALAGIDPGAEPVGWMQRAFALVESAGKCASQEILAVTPTLSRGLDDAELAVGAMRQSPVHVDLEWISKHLGGQSAASSKQARPWMRGVETARRLRSGLGFPSGPVSKEALQDLLKAKLPLPPVFGTNPKLLGGYRHSNGSHTSVVTRHSQETAQRFDIARLIASAAAQPSAEAVLAVSRTYTAHQKFQRAFASEFLCPWDELRDFVETHGTDFEALEDAAQYFQVSPLLVQTTLVNNRMLPRAILPART